MILDCVDIESLLLVWIRHNFLFRCGKVTCWSVGPTLGLLNGISKIFFVTPPCLCSCWIVVFKVLLFTYFSFTFCFLFVFIFVHFSSKKQTKSRRKRKSGLPFQKCVTFCLLLGLPLHLAHLAIQTQLSPSALSGAVTVMSTPCVGHCHCSHLTKFLAFSSLMYITVQCKIYSNRVKQSWWMLVSIRGTLRAWSSCSVMSREVGERWEWWQDMLGAECYSMVSWWAHAACLPSDMGKVKLCYFSSPFPTITLGGGVQGTTFQLLFNSTLLSFYSRNGQK